MSATKTSVPTSNRAAEPTLDESRHSPWRIVGKLAILAMVIGIAVMWGFAFFGHYTAPGRLTDRTFPIAAEPICKTAKTDLDAYQPAFLAKSAAERSDVIDMSSARLDQMIIDLRAKVPAGGSEDGINQWIDDWKQYVNDRTAYADQLRADPTARFSVTQSDRDSAQITKAVDNFASVNDMPSCVTPTDLG